MIPIYDTPTCSDGRYIYKARLSNGENLPSFILFDETTRTFTFNSQSKNDVKIYEI